MYRNEADGNTAYLGQNERLIDEDPPGSVRWMPLERKLHAEKTGEDQLTYPSSIEGLSMR